MTEITRYVMCTHTFIVIVAWPTGVNNSSEFSIIIRDYAQHLEGEARSSVGYQRSNNRIRDNRGSESSTRQRREMTNRITDQYLHVAMLLRD